MNDRSDRSATLTDALRALAEADAAAGAGPAVEAALCDTVRGLRAVQRRPRAPFLALAAALTAAAGGATWLVAMHAPAAVGVTTEVATEFLPLPYGHLPVTDAYIVRLEVPRAALIQFGLAGPDMPVSGDETVDADVLVGMDGIARAVRFVHQTTGEE